MTGGAGDEDRLGGLFFARRSDERADVVEPAVDEPEDSVVLVDETIERTAAQALIDDAGRYGLEIGERIESLHERVQPDFESYVDMLVAVDPDRAGMLDEHRDRLHANFHRIGEQRPDGWAFTRRNLVALLTKP